MLKTYWKPITGIAVKKYLLAIKKVFQCNTLKTLLYGSNKRRVFFTAVGLAILVAGYALWYQHRRQATPDTSYKLPAGPETKPQGEKAPLKETSKVPTPASGDTAQGGHWHGDEWHAEPHSEGDPNTAPIPPVQYTAPPGAVTAPVFPEAAPNEDPVKAAYKRLDYIKNNPYAWGGVHSPRATELIAQLMPPPALRDEGHAEEVHEQIEDLIAEGDPRAAEVLIANMCDGYFIGTTMFEGLDAIGPPAVPYILPYLEKGVKQGGRIRLAVFESLGRIGALYRDDLGGIVEHILIPKLEVIAADVDAERYKWAAVKNARAALAQLRR